MRHRSSTADSYSDNRRRAVITARDIQTYLSRAYYLSKTVRSYQDEIAMLRARAMKQTPTWSDTPSGGHAASSPQAVYIEKLMLKQDKLYAIASALLETEDEIRDLISILKDERARAILLDYHVFRLPMVKISDKYSYSERRIYQIRKQAYVDIARKVNADPELSRKIAVYFSD